ncbi:hypothetical protein E2C01_100557 [Portunus trituberculatus]|uniref:Uncharacterized protein n=1 Tax=Portunus trituberculatus TaxID=210409 RepID=A0A5B7KDD3_PORTR|nr:hypothetical protein [Portunus trituberculatus]
MSCSSQCQDLQEGVSRCLSADHLLLCPRLCPIHKAPRKTGKRGELLK